MGLDPLGNLAAQALAFQGRHFGVQLMSWRCAGPSNKYHNSCEHSAASLCRTCLCATCPLLMRRSSAKIWAYHLSPCPDAIPASILHGVSDQSAQHTVDQSEVLVNSPPKRNMNNHHGYVQQQLQLYGFLGKGTAPLLQSLLCCLAEHDVYKSPIATIRDITAHVQGSP